MRSPLSGLELDIENTVRAVLAVMLAVVIGFVVKCAYDRGVESAGAAKAAGALAQAARAPLVIEKLRLDTVYVRDTVRMRVAVTRYDTARIRDTVVRDSIVYVNRAAADDAVRACSAVVLTCERRLAVADSIGGTWRTQYESERSGRVAERRKGRLEKIGYALAGFGLGRLVR